MIRRDDEDSSPGSNGVGATDGLIDPIDPNAAAAAAAAATGGGGGVAFTLYLEFLGGLIPLLKVVQYDVVVIVVAISVQLLLLLFVG